MFALLICLIFFKDLIIVMVIFFSSQLIAEMKFSNDLNTRVGVRTIINLTRNQNANALSSHNQCRIGTMYQRQLHPKSRIFYEKIIETHDCFTTGFNRGMVFNLWLAGSNSINLGTTRNCLPIICPFFGVRGIMLHMVPKSQ